MDNFRHITAEGIEELLRLAKHSLHKETDFVSRRAEIEKQYADNLLQWSKQIHNALENDPLFEYGRMKKMLGLIAEEADQAAQDHAWIYHRLTALDGPAINIQRYRDQYYKCDERLLSSARLRRSFHQMDSFKEEHKQIFSEYMEMIKQAENTKLDFHKHETRYKSLMGEVRERERDRRQGAGSSERTKKLRSTAVNLESKMTVLSSKYSTIINKLEITTKNITTNANRFLLRLMEFEARRLTLVRKEMLRYLSCFRDVLNNRDSRLASLKKAEDFLGQLKPADTTRDWSMVKVIAHELPIVLDKESIESVTEPDIDDSPIREGGLKADALQRILREEFPNSITKNNPPAPPGNRQLDDMFTTSRDRPSGRRPSPDRDVQPNWSDENNSTNRCVEDVNLSDKSQNQEKPQNIAKSNKHIDDQENKGLEMHRYIFCPDSDNESDMWRRHKPGNTSGSDRSRDGHVLQPNSRVRRRVSNGETSGLHIRESAKEQADHTSNAKPENHKEKTIKKSRREHHLNHEKPDVDLRNKFVAICDYLSDCPTELSFNEGDILVRTNGPHNSTMALGYVIIPASHKGTEQPFKGYFPLDHVRPARTSDFVK